MRFRVISIFFLGCLIFPSVLPAQKQNNIWYFGQYSGIDFNTSPPTPLTNSAMSTWEGCATASDPATGALLFYTDGITVWNRTHAQMTNGSGLKGNSSSTQSALIVPLPGSPNIYYIFTCVPQQIGGYQYSIVDLGLDNGRGEVTTKNVPLLAQGTEKITAIPACNGQDIWIIAHKYGTDEFYSYLMTPAGLSTQPVISSAGMSYLQSQTVLGAMQPSPDGRRLAVATFMGRIEIFDFNGNTGRISNALTLMDGLGFYGVCFSPDNSKLYASTHSILYQFDLSSNNGAAMAASATVIHIDSVWDAGRKVPGATLAAIQNGPDGRMYVARYDTVWLAVVTRPNLAGIACGYVNFGFNINAVSPVATRSVALGLPNPVVVPSPVAPADLKTSNDTTICLGESVPLKASGAMSYFWSPAAGLSCIDCPDPVAMPDSTTTYMVGTVGEGCLGPDTAFVTVTVKPRPSAAVAAVDTLCAGASTQLFASGGGPGATYLWTPSFDLSCADCPDPTASPISTTRYIVFITNGARCTDSASVVVTVANPVSVEAGPDHTICIGTPVRLRVTGARNYRWSPSADLSCDTCAEPTASPVVTTRYMVVGWDAPDCPDTAYVTVSVEPGPVAVASADTTICAGDSVRLSVSGGVDYRYEPSDGLSCTFCRDPVARPMKTTTYRVTVVGENGCTDMDSVTVTVRPPPKVDAGRNGRICLGDSLKLHAAGAISYMWSPTASLSCSDCPDPIAFPTVTTTYTLIGTGESGCIASDTVTVAVGNTLEAIVSEDVAICPGESTRLQASGGARYAWTPMKGLSCSDCPDPIASPDVTTIYTVVVQGSGNCVGSDSASVTVTIAGKPVVKVRGTGNICVGTSTRLIASGGSAYRWRPAAGLSCDECADPIASPATTTTYTVVARNDAGCVDSASITITVADGLAVDAGADLASCSGAPVQLNATGAMNYVWTPTAGLSCSECPDPLAQPSATTTYYVMGYDSSGCAGRDSVRVTIGATPTVEARGDTIMCAGGTALLEGTTDGASWSWSPTEGVECVTCLTTTARPMSTTRYILTVVNREGCVSKDSLDVIVNDGAGTIRAVVERGRNLVPASEARVPVRLLDRPDQGAIDELLMEATFDPGVVRMDDIDLRSSLLEGWNIEESAVDNLHGVLTARMRSRSGETLRGDGVLLWLRLRGYLGSADSSELGLRIDLPGAECIGIVTTPGLVRLDSICGLSLRLIEGNAEGYSLQQNRPNPFNPTTEIEFSLGLEGPTRLEIRDAGGRLTAILVDKTMKAGRYAVTWDAGSQASGVYYYRLTSGTWSRTGVMTLMK